MIRTIYEVKYPCGLEIRQIIEKGVWHLHTINSTDDDKVVECPLHGKNCPPKGGY